jgi:HlyD family type I secretion membrane fusion protein
MKLDLTPVRSSYVAPSFDADDQLPIDPALQRRMRRPMVVGGLVILVFVVGLGTWASLSHIANGVTAQAEVRVESNRKALRARREGGTVKQILVQEGQHVRAGQPLLTFNDVEARAAYDVLQNQYDSLEAQAARDTAEATGRPSLEFPADFTGRMADQRVAGIARDQQFLFTTRTQLYQSQMSVLQQRIDQLKNQIEGDQAQVASVDEQSKLTQDELNGYMELYDKGFAPKPVVLARQRAMADLVGRKGSLIADIARIKQQMGETTMQMATTRDTRTSTAANDLRDTQSKIADTLPRLAAAKEALDGTVVKSPVDGYVFNLTQFTIGGVVGPDEPLMDVVPSNEPIIVTAMIPPQNIQKIHEGMPAQVRFTGLNYRWNSPLKGTVVLVGKDKVVNDKTNPPMSYYRADVRVDPQELTKLRRKTQITPGMPASVMIVSGGEKSVMGNLISPITDTAREALHDQQ